MVNLGPVPGQAHAEASNGDRSVLDTSGGVWTETGGFQRLQAFLEGQGIGLGGWEICCAGDVDSKGNVFVGTSENPDANVEVWLVGLSSTQPNQVDPAILFMILRGPNSEVGE